MTLQKTGTFLRQHGVHRIDITAIVMLLTALAIVLATNLPPPLQSNAAQAGTPIQALPVTNAGAMAQGNSFLLLPAWQESEIQ